MSQQTIKQRARRKAHDAVARQRKERAERERRLEDLAVQVLTAVEERDAAVVETERRAGAALRHMTQVEGLTLREAVDWCGEEISVREATRLRQLAGDDGETTAEQGAPSGSVDSASGQGGGVSAGTAAG
jgi:hypothetical protein